MGRVNRFKMRSSLTNKILIVFCFISLGVMLSYVAFNIINKSVSNLAYDLGEKAFLSNYEDIILKDYESYLDLVKKYKIDEDLNKDSFNDYYYIASFQEYDSCSESKYKEVIDIKYEDSIQIIFKIHNKCGWCKSHIALHLIKIKQINEDKNFDYDYVYAKELECGTVK